MITSEGIDQLVCALAKAKSEIKGIPMSGRNPFFKNAANPDGSKYSTFSDLYSSTNEPLSKNGLILVQEPYREQDRIGVMTTLFHNSGQWMKINGIPLKPDKDTPQAYASTLTYSKRQEAFAILGLAGDPDDDGNEGSTGHLNPKGEGEKKKPVLPKENNPISVKMFNSKNIAQVHALEKILRAEKISSDMYSKIVDFLDEKDLNIELKPLIERVKTGDTLNGVLQSSTNHRTFGEKS